MNTLASNTQGYFFALQKLSFVIFPHWAKDV